MASQITATVYKKNNSLISPALSLAFLTANSFIQHNTSANSVLSAIEYAGDTYLVSEAVSTLVTAANVGGTSMIQATLIQIDTLPVLPVTRQIAVPVLGITIYPYISGSINAIILYNGHKYFVSETEAALVTAANVGGGGGEGTVTSVALTMPTGFSVAGSPITEDGTLAVTTTLNGVLYGNGSAFTTATIGSGLVNTAGTLTNKLTTGFAGSQTVIGGTAASETLTLSSTAHATKGKILFGTSTYDEVNNRLGLGLTAPVLDLVVYNTVPIIQLANATSGFASGHGFTFQFVGLDAYVYNYDNGKLIFATNNAIAVTILASSNVGVGVAVPTSKFHVTGGITFSYVAKTANYTITGLDYTVDCTANSFTVTLPTAVGITGQIFVVVNSGAGTITIATTSSQTVMGTTPGTISTKTSLTYQSDGANWILL